MAKEKILVVEDDEDILELVEYNLLKKGFEVTCVTTGEKALEHMASSLPDLVLLDLMLPGIDGMAVCRRIKADKATAEVPVIMLTAKGAESDVISGLETGADDYIPKPFSPRILLARIKAVLRRSAAGAAAEDEPLSLHGLVINPGRHEVNYEGESLDMTQAEFRLLSLLARRPGWVFSRDRIIDHVHGEDYAVTDRSVDVMVAGIRKKLGAAGKLIETVRGVGYRFKE